MDERRCVAAAAVAAQASRGRGIRRRTGPRGVAGARPGLRVGNAEVFVEDDVDAADPVLVLRAAATAARHGAIIERRSLERLAAAASPWPEPWDDETRLQLIELSGSGPWALA